MKKLCAKQNRRAKQWEFRNQFARLRISQCSCEIGKAVANFAKDFDVFVRQMNSALWFSNFAMPISQCQIRKAKWLPTDCQLFAKIPVLLFSLLIFNICSKICTKLLKLKQEKLQKSKT